MGFTSASGYPVLAVIIIQAQSLERGEIYGTDVRKLYGEEPLNNLSDLDAYTGPGKLYLKGPCCYFRGKNIPAM